MSADSSFAPVHGLRYGEWRPSARRPSAGVMPGRCAFAWRRNAPAHFEFTSLPNLVVEPCRVGGVFGTHHSELVGSEDSTHPTRLRDYANFALVRRSAA